MRVLNTPYEASIYDFRAKSVVVIRVSKTSYRTPYDASIYNFRAKSVAVICVSTYTLVVSWELLVGVIVEVGRALNVEAPDTAKLVVERP
jgi:hypothetical protein